MKHLFALLLVTCILASCGTPATTEETLDTATVSCDSTCVDSSLSDEVSKTVVDSVK